MTFSFDANLGDPISRTRRLLLDSVEDGTQTPPLPLLTDEAIETYHTLYGINEGTAQLALILLNEYGNQPTQASDAAGEGATWGDRYKAWQTVIDSVRVFGVAGGTPTTGSTTVNRYRICMRTPYG